MNCISHLRSCFFTTTTGEEIALVFQTIRKSRDEIKTEVEEVYAELDIGANANLFLNYQADRNKR